MSAEFRALGGGGVSSIVTRWLMALARQAHAECGGRGVGAIGMCFTGNIALTMMLESVVLAPLLSQPSLPLDNPVGIEISPDEIEAVRERLDRDDLTVLAYRFEGDAFCQAERFATYKRALGDRFVARVLPDSAAKSGCPVLLRETRNDTTQRGHGSPDRRSGAADNCGARRDTGVLQPPAIGLKQGRARKGLCRLDIAPYAVCASPLHSADLASTAFRMSGSSARPPTACTFPTA